MKKKIFFCCLFSFNLIFSQNSKEFINLCTTADSLYKSKNYLNSALKFNQAFKLYKKQKINELYIYNSSCSLALAGKKKESFKQLFFLAKEKKYFKLSDISSDIDLISLQNDKKWIELLEIIKKNKERRNLELISELDTIFKDDQEGRELVGNIELKFGKNSNEYKELWKKIDFKDSINQYKIKKIIDKYSFLGYDVIGHGSEVFFFVIQHSPLNKQLEYLPILKKAYKDNKFSGSNLAYLEDRIAIQQKKKQIYGTQLSYDVEKNIVFFDCISIKNIKKIDKLRRKRDLESIIEYLQSWNIIWDPKKEKLYPEN